MRLRVFRAASVAEAMAAIRADLGPDALILSTRRGAGFAEITAALEHVDTPAAPDPADGVGTLAAVLAALRHGTPIDQVLPFGRLDLSAPLLLAGPPGAGKTLSVARLATRLVLAGQAPMVICADGQRAGAAEQLLAFTRVLGLGVVAAPQPAALRRALQRRGAGAPVLIDTPGINGCDPDQIAQIRALASAAGARIAVVLPAGIDPADAAEIAAGFVAAGATELIATRLDHSRRLGGILAAAIAGLALAEAGIGPSAADDLVAFTPQLLATRLAAQPETTA